MSASLDRVQEKARLAYPSPADVLAAKDLTREQKIKTLQEWEFDLKLMMVATEENMPGPERQGDTSERLKKIQAALDQLGRDETCPTPTKTGG